LRGLKAGWGREGSRHFRAGSGQAGKVEPAGGRGEGAGKGGFWFRGTQAEAVDGRRIDLVEVGQRAVRLHGGVGGMATRLCDLDPAGAAVIETEPKGEEGWIELQRSARRLGLIGRPNGGQVSMLARLPGGGPKVAGDYRYDTLARPVGTIEGEERQAIVADIPGDRRGRRGRRSGTRVLAKSSAGAMLVTWSS